MPEPNYQLRRWGWHGRSAPAIHRAASTRGRAVAGGRHVQQEGDLEMLGLKVRRGGKPINAKIQKLFLKSLSTVPTFS